VRTSDRKREAATGEAPDRRVRDVAEDSNDAAMGAGMPGSGEVARTFPDEPAPGGDQGRRNVRGITWMLLAVGSFSLMDAAMKGLTPHYPPLQVTALRGLASLPIVLVWVAFTGGFRDLLRVRWSLHVFRGVLSIGMLGSFLYALRELPLAETYTIFFVAPLMITALSVPLLGERVEAARWVAIVVGLLGVLVVLRPTGEGAFTLAGLACLVCAACYALSAIAVRALGRTDSTRAMVFWYTVMLTTFATALAAPGWVPVQRGHWPLLVAIAVTGAIGQLAITDAFRLGEASVIAPFEYTALGWGLLLDWVFWQTRPDRMTLVGAAIIVGAGLYLVHRERATRRARVAA
jgi:drug/metabolite transporter (DMT)-like permease